MLMSAVFDQMKQQRRKMEVVATVLGCAPKEQSRVANLLKIVVLVLFLCGTWLFELLLGN